jgi:hypothetical protein
MVMNTHFAITVEAEHIPIVASDDHEFVIPTKFAAQGFGVTPDTIRLHKKRNAAELIEGKHWVVTKCNTLGGPQKTIFWTKRGIIRLGFMINSDRAKRFRDAAEDLIIRNGVVVSPQPAALPAPRRVFLSKGISIDPESWELAQKRIKELRMTWSAYVRGCVEIEIVNGLMSIPRRFILEERTAIIRPS